MQAHSAPVHSTDVLSALALLAFFFVLHLTFQVNFILCKIVCVDVTIASNVPFSIIFNFKSMI